VLGRELADRANIDASPPEKGPMGLSHASASMPPLLLDGLLPALQKDAMPPVLAWREICPAARTLCWALSHCKAVERADMASCMSAAALAAAAGMFCAAVRFVLGPFWRGSVLQASDTQETLVRANRSSWPARRGHHSGHDGSSYTLKSKPVSTIPV
jgi:hypothetical protein